MSWTQQLFQTYERLSNTDCGLTAIAHMYAKAQLEVTLNAECCFVSAEIVSKENEKTLIPVTEASSGRSSGSAPHALNDTLSYIAGDFTRYERKKETKSTGKKKKNNTEPEKTISQKKFEDYMKGLENWCFQKDANRKVLIIFKYLKKQTLIEDLVKAGIVHIENGEFTEEKIQGQEYAKVLVRFRVLDGSEESRTWEDKNLIQNYTQYYLENQKGIQDICFITGKQKSISENHPKNIVSAYGNAKLISANDDAGFTYRGRFESSQQANTISYEASQKIHGALKWLVSNQGYAVGNKTRRTFICWNPDGRQTGEFFSAFPYEFDEEEDSYCEDQKTYKKKLGKLISGYEVEFKKGDSVIIAGFDAATTGRLSVTYYQELLASDYWENISYWGNTLNWYFLRFSNEKKPIWNVETPPLWKVIQCAYGNAREKRIEVDDEIMKEHVQRLIKSMIERQKVPKDILIALVKKASTPLAYTWDKGHSYNWELVLSTACAVIMKDRIDRGKIKEDDQYIMKLDKTNSDRSYLFGRLLAIYEKIERRSMDQEEARETNAIRLQAAFVNHPGQTWKILEGVTKPYLIKLEPKTREYYKHMITEIVSTFEDADQKKMNLELSESYLLGYYLQRMEFEAGKLKEENENE